MNNGIGLTIIDGIIIDMINGIGLTITDGIIADITFAIHQSGHQDGMSIGMTNVDNSDGIIGDK